MGKLTLKVTGMTCGHCQRSVEEALRKIPGVYGAVVDLRNATAEVDYDDDTATLDELTEAVAKAGYAAVVEG
jgi:copper chaperone